MVQWGTCTEELHIVKVIIQADVWLNTSSKPLNGRHEKTTLDVYQLAKT